MRSARVSLGVFFVLTFGLSWLVWGSWLLHERGVVSWQLSNSLAFLAVSVSTVVVTCLVSGRAGLRGLLKRLVTWRVPPRWYLAALLLPALPALAALAMFTALGGQHDVGALVPVSAAVPLLLSQLVLHLLTEEMGWRGFALPRLRAVLGPLSASLVLGPIWAAWHIPTFLLSDSRQSYPFPGFVLQVLAITVIMTWIFDRTHGSVLIAALFHAAMNTEWALLNILWGDVTLFWLCVGFTVVVAVVIATLQARDSAAPRADEDDSAPSGESRSTSVAGV
ncbi:MAG TPA: CPBP family intramembrane glutamic endopeptidase [Propionibacteriaceae bacterium]|jgi:membrane protease YdiL (CAAX protease family)